MKKLLILAAVACAAITSQANQSYMFWAEKLGTAADGYTYSGEVTLYISTHTIDWDSENEESIDYIDTYYSTTVNASGGRFFTVDGYTTELPSFEEEVEGQSWSAYFTYDLGNMTYTSQTVNGTYDPSITTLSTLSYNFGDASTYNGWSSVPEPTSGLLMLLGLAGLALKRKQI